MTANRFSQAIKLNVGFWLGIILFWAMYLIPTPEGMSPAAQKTAAITLLMICWWVSEAIPIAVTALVPLAAFPVFGVLNSREAAAPYADDNVFLFLGGFCIAIAMEKWNLHKRIALHIIRFIGGNPRQVVLGFMAATAFISMWISNTATTMMMLPIGLAVIQHYHRGGPKHSNFGAALMLGIAYSASIGGIGTLIGTPPNIVLAGQMKIFFPQIPEIGFFQWMQVGVPLVLIFLPLTWWYLTFAAFPLKHQADGGVAGIIREEIARLGRMTKEEIFVSLIFALTCLGWMFRKTITVGAFTLLGWSDLLGIGRYTGDATVAVVAALVLFMIPVDLKARKYLLDWESAQKMPWGILLLFGGGFSLANAFESTSLSQWLGKSIEGFSTFPVIGMMAAVCLVTTFITEVTSNTATATMILPVLAARALATGVHPLLLMMPAAISASCAFMTPVGTPPNAIVFASGEVTIPMMARTGLVLNFIGVVLVTLLVYFIAAAAFGIVL